MSVPLGSVRVFRTKGVSNQFGTYSIILQDENGPCAIVAICNALVLKDTPMAQFIAGKDSVSSTELQSKLIDMIVNGGHGDLSLGDTQNTDTNVALNIIPRIVDGLEVNPRFDGSFSDSEELRVFEVFRIPLVHGWILGENETQELGIEGSSTAQLSYEEFCDLQFSDNPNENLKIFVQACPTQLSKTGHRSLIDQVGEGEYAVLFWNNHFSTVTQNKGRICLLATDLGYQGRKNVCWEVLDISGAGAMLSADFKDSNDQINADEQLAKALERQQLIDLEQGRRRPRQSRARGQVRYEPESKSAPTTLEPAECDINAPKPNPSGCTRTHDGEHSPNQATAKAKNKMSRCTIG